MLKVDQYSYIRTAHRVYGKKVKQLARKTGHSKNTIRKVLRGEYNGYTPRVHQPYPVIGPYMHLIDQWLIEDKDRPKKQRHTAMRVYNRLKQEHGFAGAETTVRKYVRETKARLGLDGRQAFVACLAAVGAEAEVDWGTCQAIIGGEPIRLKLFCIRSKYSGKHFVRCYPCERQQALFDAHIQAFDFFGGVFGVLIYDNLSTAVQRVYHGKKRDLQESFSKFVGYYNFEPRFCNPGAGHEKGGVEGLVGYARRNYMVPVPEADTLEALNDRLLKNCIAYGEHTVAGRTHSVNELYEHEKAHLIELPRMPFSNVAPCTARVDKYATVMVDKNRYSVPSEYAHLWVKVLVYVDRLKIYYGSKKIAEHSRGFGNNHWHLDPCHYFELIRQRPEAFDSARAIVQWRKRWPQCLEQLLQRFCAKQGRTKGIKDFISVLMLYKSYKPDDVQTAVELALTADGGNSAVVEHILKHSTKPGEHFESLPHWQRFAPADVSVYGQIGGEL